MPTGGRSTLTQFLIEERRSAPGATGELDSLIADVSLACKAIARRVAYGRLRDTMVSGTVTTPRAAPQASSASPDSDTAREAPPSLDDVTHGIFLHATEWGGHLAGMVSAESIAPHAVPSQYPRGKYLLLFDALDGSLNVDVNVTVGSVFSILRAPTDTRDAVAEDFLQAGTRQVCAGYAVYGPCTMLVLTMGRGTHGFTLDPTLGEWVLSHPSLRIPSVTREFAINLSNSRFWQPAVKRYVDECLAGLSGPRMADFNMRWIASLVAETHRILVRGGVFLYPRDTKDPSVPGRLRLLYEANPVAFLIEQAGGMASTGLARVMEIEPTSLHQRIGFLFGSRDEVERIERYHHEDPLDSYDSPLFGRRGLFAIPD